MKSFFDVVKDQNLFSLLILTNDILEKLLILEFLTIFLLSSTQKLEF